MTRSNFVFMSSLIMKVIACFLVLASAEEKSSVVNQDRQSKQILLTSESYNFPSSPLPYFNPYGRPLVVLVGDVFPYPNVPYLYSLSSHECLLSNLPTEGSVRCRQASQARRGNIYIKFSAGDQIANFAITAPTNFNIRLTCSEITTVKAFTQSVEISKTSDTPVTESEYINIAVRSASAGGDAGFQNKGNGALKCNWESSRQLSYDNTGRFYAPIYMANQLLH